MTTQTEQTAASNPEKTNVARRIAPAVCLFSLAPLIAEYLLGDLPIKLLIALVFLAPLYGGGALLIRESARRAGRGWPTIILLGLAYAIVEEAFTTQSLFNPDYLKLKMHLLDPAYIPALGIGGWWTMLMLNLHAAGSIATPIVLIEAAFPQRANKPWLGRTGYFVTALIFVAGATAAIVTQKTRSLHGLASSTRHLCCARSDSDGRRLLIATPGSARHGVGARSVAGRLRGAGVRFRHEDPSTMGMGSGGRYVGRRFDVSGCGIAVVWAYCLGRAPQAGFGRRCGARLRVVQLHSGTGSRRRDDERSHWECHLRGGRCVADLVRRQAHLRRSPAGECHDRALTRCSR